MPDFFVVLLKINIVLLLFGATYCLVLRRLTFYTLNRFFLAFGILFATIYPFIDLTDFFLNQKNEAVAFVPQLNQKVSEMVPSDFIAINWQVIMVVFYLGVAFMAFRLIVQFVSLYKMHRKSKPGYVANHQVRILDEPVSPFSFWQTVYINPALHKKTELDTILAHENVHVKQWHSLDIILAELSVVFYWFNPGVWLMKKAVKENLEFITDQKILNKGVDRKVYQYSLLDVGNLTPAVEIVNNFNLSDLKKRIKMMNSKRSSKLTLSRYLFVLPVLLLTTLAFTVSKKEIKESFAPINRLVSSVVENNDIPSEEIVVIPAKKKINKKVSRNSVPKQPEQDNVSQTLPTLDIKRDTTVLVLVKRGEEASTGDEILSRLKGRVTGVALYKDTLITKKGSASVKMNFGYKAEAMPSKITTISNVVVRGYPTKAKADSVASLKNVKFVFEGKQIYLDEFSKMDANQIESINIVKGTSTGAGTITVVGRKKD